MGQVTLGNAVPDVTVLIATFNGAGVLRRTLGGYVSVAGNDPDWKIVVVDNASTDETAEVLEQFSSRLPLTYRYVGVPGKNLALNAGLSEIEGDFVILSDDDAIPQPGFLDAWRSTMQRYTDIDIFGGEVIPVFDVAPPDWFLRETPNFEALYAMRKGIPEGPIAPDQIFGPNMAVRRHVFAEGMRFSTEIGPNSSEPNYAMGSETEFCVRAVRQGYKSGFASVPRVHHIVRAQQVTPEFFRRRAYRLGRGIAKKQWDAGEIKARQRSRPFQIVSGVRRSVRKSSRYILSRIPGGIKQFQRQWDYDFFCGFQDEYRRLISNMGANSPGDQDT